MMALFAAMPNEANRSQIGTKRPILNVRYLVGTRR